MIHNDFFEETKEVIVEKPVPVEEVKKVAPPQIDTDLIAPYTEAALRKSVEEDDITKILYRVYWKANENPVKHDKHQTEMVQKYGHTMTEKRRFAIMHLAAHDLAHGYFHRKN